MNVSATLLKSLAFVNASGVLLDFSVITFDPVGFQWGHNRTVAMECVLRACAPSYVSTLNRSQFLETNAGEILYPASTTGVWPNAFYYHSLNNESFSVGVAGTDNSFSMTPALAAGYANWLVQLFTTTAGYFTIMIKNEAINQFTYSSPVAQPLFAATNSTDLSFSLPILMDNVARSLSVYLRTSSTSVVDGVQITDQLQFRAS